MTPNNLDKWPELRKDPVVGRWVIISTERGRRPSELSMPEESPTTGPCPFCEGNEANTPPEIRAYRERGGGQNTPGWDIRVVPNKYPALRVEGNLTRTGEGIYDLISGVGAHEVIIETPNHEVQLADLSISDFEKVLWSYKERILDLKRDTRLKYILIFKNHGAEAGATLSHSHSQLIALPIIPKTVQEEMTGAEEYFNFKERCIYCDIVHQESKERVRVISENHDFLAIAPYAPKSPFETWILPKVHESSFESCERCHFGSLAQIFSDTLRRMNKVLRNPPYNFILHTAPVKNGVKGCYHWHFEIMPKLAAVAGFEWGSGFYINPTPPEESARFLRDVVL